MRAAAVLLLVGCAGHGVVTPDGLASAPSTTVQDPTVQDTTTTVQDTVEASTGCPAVTDDSAPVVVTDIDETLTTLDSEYLTQLAFPDHVPEMRPGASAVMNQWYALGYRVIYVTARGADLPLIDGTPARQATEDWLALKQFPFTSRDVFLAPGVQGLTDTAGYKIEVLADLADAGFDVVWAYGNADTDIEAYKAAGIPDDHIWLVGKLAGQYGVNPLPTDEAYEDHLATFMPTAPCAPE